MKSMNRRLTDSVALGIACCLLIGCVREPVGVILTYRVRPDAAVNEPIELEYLVTTLDHRLRGIGVAKALSNGNVEVHLNGTPDPAALESIKFRIDSIGVLEFRIVADTLHLKDRPIIDLAKALPPTERKVMQNGNKVAEWVAYSEEEFGPVDENVEGLVKRLPGEVPEALVLIDPLNVTGQYLTEATKGLDERGGPAIYFALDKEGARRFRMLTSQNKPNPGLPNLYRHLGIILDKRLLSAPRIITTISDRGQISGGAITERDVDDIIAIFHAGALPYPIEFVDERRVAQ